ncbi:MAG TPA: ribonuclease III [Epulopiscium sp.]|nr:ribonuclease III [Candidatus Epulonipiscium sp.]
MPKGFEQNIGYEFTMKDILTEALTHSSYANEHKANKLRDNERLEFLGDAILDLVVSEFLYKKHTDLPEGDLSKIRASVVCEAFLIKAAKEIHLGQFLLLGKGEEMTGGRERTSVLADAFEAVIGAIYLDGGLGSAQKFIHQFIISFMETLAGSKRIEDYKTHLQETIQKGSIKPLSYVVVNEQGPDHEKCFEVQVNHDGRVLGEGSGRTKKEAEQKAAYVALQKLQA